MTRIREWPQGERPRERLLKEGADVLSDAQLLAILLRIGSDRMNAVQLAMHLLEQFHTLSNLANLSVTELCSIRGIGPAKAAQLKAALELGRRSLASPLSNGTKLASSQDVFNHFAPLLRHAKKEVFKIVLLDQKNKVIRNVTVSEGSLTWTVVHPREVFNPAVRDSAASVIFLHNHPSGDPAPSQEDKEMTRRLAAAGDLMGIQVLDHIIIGDNTYFSFADAGYMISLKEQALWRPRSSHRMILPKRRSLSSTKGKEEVAPTDPALSGAPGPPQKARFELGDSGKNKPMG